MCFDILVSPFGLTQLADLLFNYLIRVQSRDPCPAHRPSSLQRQYVHANFLYALKNNNKS